MPRGWYGKIAVGTHVTYLARSVFRVCDSESLIG
ncbi:hypothetical protein SBBP2_2840002 [Burkholderiales bacterium]|nr:hypothetical protein SBBP2_2840002 [Burkholderiales bacterium]